MIISYNEVKTLNAALNSSNYPEAGGTVPDPRNEELKLHQYTVKHCVNLKFSRKINMSNFLYQYAMKNFGCEIKIRYCEYTPTAQN